ncbi:MAG: DUF507 family protein [Bdellovibrionaceae bacterium]|nr:DUF507 family protein [Pseudobdellovibrionaceae bacterium]
MNWNELVALRISELVINRLCEDSRFKLNEEEENIRKEVEKEIHENFTQEKNLIKEVYKMMEDLEKQGQSFDRQQIFPMLKQQLAKKKGIIL